MSIISIKKNNNKKSFFRNKGFTLIELLIVISIIAILSSIVISSVNTARRKARAAKLVNDLQQIEKALSAWGIDEGITQWWQEDVWGAPTDEPTISWLVDNTNLSVWMPGNPNIDGDLYVYDNDEDTFDANGDGCADDLIYRGVNLNIWDKNLLDVVGYLDKMVDNGDGPSCGRVVWDPDGVGGYFIGYRIGNNSHDLKF